jgi:hypothetical protein
MKLEIQSGPTGGHPAPEDLHRLMRGELAGAEARIVVRHLLRGCPACTRETRTLWGFGEEPTHPLPEPPPLPVREVGLWK